MLKNNIQKIVFDKKKYILFSCFIVLVVCFSICIINSKADSNVDSKEFYMWNKHISGNFRLGNDIEALRNGGTVIELGAIPSKGSYSTSSGSEENVIQVDGNKINLYYDVYIKHSHWYDFLPFVGPNYTHKEEHYTILEKDSSNIKNLNITDYKDNKKENILYYTVDGKAMAFNLKTKKDTELFGIEDNNQMLNIEVMFLVDNEYLYILSDSRTYVYNIKEETTKKLDICTSVKANFFIPTDLGSIFFSNKAIIVKDTNFMDYVFEAKYNSNCSNFKFCNIDEEKLTFALSLAETESELAKDVKYEIDLKNLFDYSFGSISEEAIGKVIKLIDDSTLYDENEYKEKIKSVSFKFKNQHKSTDYTVGSDYNEIMNGGSNLKLSSIRGFYSKDNKIIYYYKDENGQKKHVELAMEKQAENINFQNVNAAPRLFYTVNKTAKVLLFSSGKKACIEPLRDKKIDRMYLLDNKILSFLSEGKIYEYDIAKETITEIEESKGDFIPTSKGYIHLTDGEKGKEAVVNNVNITKLLTDSFLNQNYKIKEYTTDANNLYILLDVNIGDSENYDYVYYKISMDKIFSSPSKEDFIIWDNPGENESYNYTSKYTKVENNYSKLDYSSNYRLGNSVDKIIKKGSSLDLGDDNKIYTIGEDIYFKNQDRKIPISEADNAKNINMSSGDSKIVYYTINNKIKSVDLQTGKTKCIVTMDKNRDTIDMMYLVGNKYLYYSCNDTVYCYDISSEKVEVIEKGNDLVGFIPTGYEDKNILITNIDDKPYFNVDGKDLSNIIKELYDNNNCKIVSYGSDIDCLYFRLVTGNSEKQLYRIKFADLFNNPTKDSFEKYDNGWSRYIEYDYNCPFSIKAAFYSACNIRLGATLSEIKKGGTYLKLLDKSDNNVYSNKNQLFYKYKDPTYHETGDMKTTLLNTDEGNIGNINYYDSNLVYTVNGKIKKLDLKTGNNKYIDKLKDYNAKQMYIADDGVIYFLNDSCNCIYKCSFSGPNSESVRVLDLSKHDNISYFEPTGFGVIVKASNSDILLDHRVINADLYNRIANNFGEKVSDINSLSFDTNYLYFDVNTSRVIPATDTTPEKIEKTQRKGAIKIESLFRDINTATIE